MHIFYMKILHLVASIVVGGGFGRKGMVEEQLEERETLRKVSEANHWFQSQVKDYQREVEESRIAKEELATQVKESEKKQKTLEAELIQLQEDLDLSERARKSAESERDELHEEINNSTSKGSLLIDEKRRLEARIQQLEEEMEEEQGNSEVLLEKARKSQTQIEQLMADLGTEKATSQMLENSRMMLERQNKELKLKLQDIESSQRAKSKTAIASLESKLAQLEEQLEEETREKQNIAKSSRKLEKRVKELLLQLDDERRHADQYKEQYIKWKKFYKLKKNHDRESWARARLAEICLIDYHTIEDGLRVIIKYIEVGFNRVPSPDRFDLLMQNSKGELSHQVLSERFPELNDKDDKDDSRRKDDINEFDSDRDDDESYDYDGKDKRDKDRRKKRRKRAHMVTCDPYLLLSFVYFDQTHCGYLLDKDIEEILKTLGLMLSRAQIVGPCSMPLLKSSSRTAGTQSAAKRVICGARESFLHRQKNQKSPVESTLLRKLPMTSKCDGEKKNVQERENVIEHSVLDKTQNINQREPVIEIHSENPAKMLLMSQKVFQWLGILKTCLKVGTEGLS